MRSPLALLSVSFVTLTSLMPAGAWADPTFPGRVQAHLGLSYTPPCNICHTSPAGFPAPASQPFALAMNANGLVAPDQQAGRERARRPHRVQAGQRLRHRDRHPAAQGRPRPEPPRRVHRRERQAQPCAHVLRRRERAHVRLRRPPLPGRPGHGARCGGPPRRAGRARRGARPPPTLTSVPFAVLLAPVSAGPRLPEADRLRLAGALPAARGRCVFDSRGRPGEVAEWLKAHAC
jgi:hypothetical protein